MSRKKKKAGQDTKNEDKKNFVFALVLLAASIIILLSAIFMPNEIVLETKEVYASLGISEVTGINVNNTALTFGNIMPGSSASRNLIFTNQYGFPVRLEIKAEGNISRFLRFERYVYARLNETKSISIIAVVSAGEEYADYSGKILVAIKKAI